MSFSLDNDLPQYWESTTLDEVTLPYETTQPTKKLDTEFQYIDIGSIDNATQTVTSLKTFLGKDAPSRARRVVKKGDVLFSTVRTYLKNIALVPAELDGVLTSTGIAVLRAASGIDSKYLFYFVSSDQFIREISSAMDGTLYPAVTDSDVASAQIFIPPLNEQRRIVAKIEALRARSQQVKEAIASIPPLLDQFRQSVLAAAFRGDLTADWREKNPDVEPASVLLEHICIKRRRRWCEEVARKGKNLSNTKYQEPINADTSRLSGLPDNWIWATLDQLLFVLRNGLSKPPADQLPGISILRISAVRAMEVNTNDIRFYRTDAAENISSYLLEAGDLLFTRYNGSRSFVGVCGLVPDLTHDLLYPDKLIRGQLVDKLLCLPEYLELSCNFGVSRSHIDSHIKTSAGQQGIAGSDIKSTPIPLPPLAEQYAIVRIVKQQFSAMQSLAYLTDDCVDDSQRLEQSILTKAFRGELVPQDLNDEPASVLLERIRAERTEREAAAKAAKKTTGKTTKRRNQKAQQQADSTQLELPGLEQSDE